MARFTTFTLLLALAGCANDVLVDEGVVTLAAVGTNTLVDSENIDGLVRLQNLAVDLEKEHGQHMAEVGFLLTSAQQEEYTRQFWGSQSTDPDLTEFATRDQLYTRLNEASAALHEQVRDTMVSHHNRFDDMMRGLTWNEDTQEWTERPDVRDRDLTLFLKALEALSTTQYVDDVAGWFSQAISWQNSSGAFPAQVVAGSIRGGFVDEVASEIAEQKWTMMLLSQAEAFTVDEYLKEVACIFGGGEADDSCTFGGHTGLSFAAEVTAATGAVRGVWEKVGGQSVTTAEEAKTAYESYVLSLTRDADVSSADRSDDNFLEVGRPNNKLRVLRGSLAAASAWHALHSIPTAVSSDNPALLTSLIALDESITLAVSAQTGLHGLHRVLRLVGRGAKVANLAGLVDDSVWFGKVSAASAYVGLVAEAANIYYLEAGTRNNWDYFAVAGSVVALGGSVLLSGGTSIVVVAGATLLNLAFSTLASWEREAERRAAVEADIRTVLMKPELFNGNSALANALIHAEPEAVEILRGEAHERHRLFNNLDFSVQEIQELALLAPDALDDENAAGVLSLLVGSGDLCLGADPVESIRAVSNFSDTLDDLTSVFSTARNVHCNEDESECDASFMAAAILEHNSVDLSGSFEDELICERPYNVYLPLI